MPCVAISYRTFLAFIVAGHALLMLPLFATSDVLQFRRPLSPYTPQNGTELHMNPHPNPISSPPHRVMVSLSLFPFPISTRLQHSDIPSLQGFSNSPMTLLVPMRGSRWTPPPSTLQPHKNLAEGRDVNRGPWWWPFRFAMPISFALPSSHAIIVLF